MKVELSGPRAGRTLPPMKFLVTDVCYRLSGPHSYRMRTEEIGHLRISKDLTGNRNCNLQSCSTLSQPTALPQVEI